MSKEENNQIDLEEAIAMEVTHERSKELLKIQEQYGDGIEYDRNRVLEEAMFYMDRSAEAWIEAGRRLVMIHAFELKEVYQEALERLNIEERTGRQMRQAAFKYRHLTDKQRQTSATLGRSKLIELMVLEDEEIGELMDGGTIADLTLTDIQQKSVRELREELRASKEDQDAVRAVSANNQKKINELSEKLEKAEAKAKREIEKLKLEESETDQLIKSYSMTLADVTGTIGASINHLNQIFTQATEAVLPASFMREFAVKVSNLKENIEALQYQLPTDSDAIDDSWLEEN